MAKVKYGAYVVDMRNKVGGTIYSKNNGGAYAKNLVIPTNTITTQRTSVRSAMTTLSQQWRTLTDAQRLTFIMNVLQWRQTDVFGDLKTPSGINLFIKLNIYRVQRGLSVITTCPVPVQIPRIQSLSLAASVSGVSITTVTTPSVANIATRWGVFMSPPMSAGVTSHKQSYCFIKDVAPTTSVGNLFTLYTTRYGVITAGQKIFIKIIVYQVNSGQFLRPVFAVGTVTA